MIAIYVGALVVGLGVVGVQIFGGHDADAAGHDVHAADHDGSAWTLVASLRFWAFALVAFGLTGALIHALGLAGAAATALVAGGAGLASGFAAASVVRRMTRGGPTSQVLRGDVVGRVGRVIVPGAAGARAKVRVEIKGALVDYVASSRERLDENDAVVVEDYDGREVVVSKAPRELTE